MNNETNGYELPEAQGFSTPKPEEEKPIEQAMETMIKNAVFFWHDRGVQLDEADVRREFEAIPEVPGFDWYLYVPKGLSFGSYWEDYYSKHSLHSYYVEYIKGKEHLKDDLIEPSEHSEGYAIATRYKQHADTQFRFYTVEELERLGFDFMSPLERLIAGQSSYILKVGLLGYRSYENVFTLDKVGGTVCPGYRIPKTAYNLMHRTYYKDRGCPVFSRGLRGFYYLDACTINEEIYKRVLAKGAEQTIVPIGPRLVITKDTFPEIIEKLRNPEDVSSAEKEISELASKVDKLDPEILEAGRKSRPSRLEDAKAKEKGIQTFLLSEEEEKSVRDLPSDNILGLTKYWWGGTRFNHPIRAGLIVKINERRKQALRNIQSKIADLNKEVPEKKQLFEDLSKQHDEVLARLRELITQEVK